MIPTIGILIAAYCIARLVEQLTRKDEPVVARVFAVIAMIAIGICALSLIVAGGTATTTP